MIARAAFRRCGWWRIGLAAAVILLPSGAMAADSTGRIAIAPLPADQTSPARVQVGRQIIAVMFPPAQRDAMLAGLVSTMLKQFRSTLALPPGFDDPGLRKIMDTAFDSIPARLQPAMNQNFPLVLEAMAHGYAHEFSLSELQAILAFAQTPAGQHYLSRSLAIASDPSVVEANGAYFRQVQGVSAQIRTDVQQQVTDYLKLHPDLAAKLQKSHAGAAAVAPK